MEPQGIPTALGQCFRGQTKFASSDICWGLFVNFFAYPAFLENCFAIRRYLDFTFRIRFVFGDFFARSIRC